MACFLLVTVLWVFSVCLHEFGHAVVALYGGDYSCVGGDGSVNLPGALFRGGGFYFGPADGVFAAVGFYVNRTFDDGGFRCARAL